MQQANNMNTPIVKISDDQNEITHESGVVTVFVESNKSTCLYCAYLNDDGGCICEPAPCNVFRRKDYKLGHFTLKQPTT